MQLFRRFFENSPAFIRGPISRKRIDLRAALQGDTRQEEIPNSPQPFVIKIAETQEELSQAFRVLHDSYVAKKYMSPSPSQMRVTPYHVLPTTTTFIALVGSEVVGTMSIIKDGVFGLPTEHLFDLSFLRKKGAKLAEVSSLAIDPKYRTRGGACLFLLIKYLIDYAYNFMGVDTLAISVNPAQQILYDDILLFDKIPQKEIKPYSFVDGAPAIGRYVRIADFNSRTKKIYNSKTEEKNLHQFIFNSKSPHLFLPQRSFYKVMDPVMTSEILNSLLKQEPQIFDSLPHEKKVRFLMHYQGSSLERTLRKYLFSNDLPLIQFKRKNIRFDSDIYGFLESSNFTDKPALVCVNNVAQEGVMLSLTKKEEKKKIEQSKFILNVSVAPKIVSRIQLEVVANPKTQSGEAYCCRLVDADSQWEKYIHHLKSDFEGPALQVASRNQEDEKTEDQSENLIKQAA